MRGVITQFTAAYGNYIRAPECSQPQTFLLSVIIVGCYSISSRRSVGVPRFQESEKDRPRKVLGVKHSLTSPTVLGSHTTLFEIGHTAVAVAGFHTYDGLRHPNMER